MITCEGCRQTVQRGELVLPFLRMSFDELLETRSVIHVRCLVDLTLDRVATPAIRACLIDYLKREGP